MQSFEGRLSRAATAGEYFAAELVEPAGLTDLSVDWPADVDLTFERSKDGVWLLSGILATPKLHEFTLHGQINGKPASVNLRLPVSPDPWSMWQDLPVDWDTLPYPKQDTATMRISGDHVMIGASRRGRSHAHKALPRDDDMRVAFDAQTGWHVMVVADGAGSAEFSRLGSETAAETVSSVLFRSLPDDPTKNEALRQSLIQAMLTTAQALDALADKSSHPLGSFNTTLLVAVAKQIDDGWFLGSISVGDGLVGVIADNEQPLMMSVDHGEFAGQTTFLRNDMIDAKKLGDRIHTRSVSDFTAFIAMTDGVSDPMFASQSATADPAAWADLLTQIEMAGVQRDNPDAHNALLEWLNFRVKGEHDDRTIAILYPNGGVA